jgi:predicted nuclease of predicted toxin-antitoxin system
MEAQAQRIKVRFLADECVFVQTVRLVQECGFEIYRIQDLGMRGAKDNEVLQKAHSLQAVLITNDRGFSNIYQYPPSLYHGIIVLKMIPNRYTRGRNYV